MTDTDLEQRLRAWYEATMDDSERAPLALRSELASLAMAAAKGRRAARRGWTFASPLGLASTTLAAVAASVTLLVGLTVITQPAPVAPSMAPGPSTTSVQSATPVVSAAPSERVRGWPGNGPNDPGLYSWGNYCPPSHCRYGWMHNGYGDGNVEILIAEGGIPKTGATPATVAGRDGLYRRAGSDGIGPLQEDWQLEVDGVSIHIRLTAKVEASEAELAEAHAIIESMYIEPAGPDDFRLVFRLATADWDSG